jgi:hypothetical protein
VSFEGGDHQVLAFAGTSVLRLGDWVRFGDGEYQVVAGPMDWQQRLDPLPQRFVDLPWLRHDRSTSEPEAPYRTTSPSAHELKLVPSGVQAAGVPACDGRRAAGRHGACGSR